MTDEEILGPPAGATVYDLAGRYPIEAEGPEGELEALGIDPEYEDMVDQFDLKDHCYINLRQHRSIHGRSCRCIVPSDLAGDSAMEA